MAALVFLPIGSGLSSRRAGCDCQRRRIRTGCGNHKADVVGNMLSSTIVIAATLGYAGLLFLVAWLGDHRKAWLATPVARAAIYGLSLAVYCTSWTFFGAVGTAARDGWDYLPIYLGPILVFVAAFPVVARLVDTARRIRVTSVADFFSARYG
jgi:Na+/proline symporter